MCQCTLPNAVLDGQESTYQKEKPIDGTLGSVLHIAV